MCDQLLENTLQPVELITFPRMMEVIKECRNLTDHAISANRELGESSDSNYFFEDYNDNSTSSLWSLWSGIVPGKQSGHALTVVIIF